jgi:hypothetical protein
MNSTEVTGSEVNRDESWLFRVGGMASLAIGVAYIVIIALYASVGAPPEGGEARLNYLARRDRTVWIAGLHRDAPHQRDRHSYGAWRDESRCDWDGAHQDSSRLCS